MTLLIKQTFHLDAVSLTTDSRDPEGVKTIEVVDAHVSWPALPLDAILSRWTIACVLTKACFDLNGHHVRDRLA